MGRVSTWPIFIMLYSFQCASGSTLDVSTSGVVSCFDGSNYSAVTSVLPVSLQPTAIDPTSGFTDGMTLGWGVAAAMAAAWAIHTLRRAF